MLMGLGFVGVSLVTGVAGMLVPGVGGGAFSDLGGFFLIGAAAFGFGALRLPGWARRRRDQMEELARRVTQLPPDPNRA
jgi:hypothetical protein